MSSPLNNTGPRPGTPGVSHGQGSNKPSATPSSGVRRTTVVGEFEVGPEYGRARLQDRKVTEVTRVGNGRFSHEVNVVPPSPSTPPPGNLQQHVLHERTITINERTVYHVDNHRESPSTQPSTNTTATGSGTNVTNPTEKKSSSSWLRFIGIAALVTGIALAVIGWHIANPILMKAGAGTAVFGAGALLASFRKSGVQPDGSLKV